MRLFISYWYSFLEWFPRYLVWFLYDCWDESDLVEPYVMELVRPVTTQHHHVYHLSLNHRKLYVMNKDDYKESPSKRVMDHDIIVMRRFFCLWLFDGCTLYSACPHVIPLRNVVQRDFMIDVSGLGPNEDIHSGFKNFTPITSFCSCYISYTIPLCRPWVD